MGIGPDHQTLPHDVFVWTCLPFFPMLHYLRSLLSAFCFADMQWLFVQCCIAAFAAFIAPVKMLYIGASFLSHIVQNIFSYFCVPQCVCPETCAHPVTTRGLCGSSSLTLIIILFSFAGFTHVFFQNTVGGFLPCLTFCLTEQEQVQRKCNLSHTPYILPYIFHYIWSQCCVNEDHKPLTLNGKMHLGRLLAWGKGVLRHTWNSSLWY